MARSEHLNKIKNNGLKVIVGNSEFIAKPSIATDNPAKIGAVDFFLSAQKPMIYKRLQKR